VGTIYVDNTTFIAKAVSALKTADTTVIADAGIAASGIADGYLSKRFALPLIAPFDAGLCAKVFDLMQYEVASQVGFRAASGQNEVMQLKRDAAEKWLLGVSDGTIGLPLQIDSTPDIDEEGSEAASDCRIGFRDVIGRAGRGNGGGRGCW
jgi:phage gp36-like protein